MNWWWVHDGKGDLVCGLFLEGQSSLIVHGYLCLYCIYFGIFFIYLVMFNLFSNVFIGY